MVAQTILFMAANPAGTDCRALDQQSRAIRAELERAGKRDCFRFETRWAAQPLDLLRDMVKLRPAVVHFCGGRLGGQGDAARSTGVYFQAADGGPQPVPAAALAQAFDAAGSSVKLVVLDACYSEAHAEAVAAHVDCVVGMAGETIDGAATSFAIGLYSGLGEGEPVSAAFKQGRAAIALMGVGDAGQPRLVTRPGADAGRLVLANRPALPMPIAAVAPDDRVAAAGRMQMHAGDLGPADAPRHRVVDVVIMTAIPLEFDAVRAVDAGAVPGSTWESGRSPSGLPVAYRSFTAASGRPLRVAVSVAADMGATAVTNALLPLVEQLQPRCVAMCGVCAGRRGKVQLGDVIAADRLYYHDAGKQLPDEVQQDLMTFNLRDDWKAALRGFQPAEHFRGEGWLRDRPWPAAWREHRALLALRDGSREPWTAFDPPLKGGEWQAIVTELRKRQLLAPSGRELTDEGRRLLDDLLFDHMGQLPDLSPWGALLTFRLHVAPMGTGARVVEDEKVWSFVSSAMRKTLGLEMEAAAVGELAHRQHQHHLQAVVMKGVMDFADHGRDDHFKEFASRAAAECLMWFLRGHIATEVTPGFDDLLSPGTQPLPGELPPSALLNARYAVVPWHEAGRIETLAALDAWADDPSLPVSVQLLHAEGGVGKTRLAIEWVHRRRDRHDVAGFLIPGPPASWFERLCNLGAPAIIVIDYAESRPDLLEILQRIAAFHAAGGKRGRIRALLLARNAGDWWTAIAQDTTLRGLLVGREPLELRALAMGAAERAAVFVEAAKRFAELRQRATAPNPPQTFPFGDPRFERVLYVHMAALLAVEAMPPASTAPDAVPAQPAALEPGSLLDEVIAHEEQFWVRQAKDVVVRQLDVQLARQLVAAATLRGGLKTAVEAYVVCERLTGRRPRDRADEALLGLLHNIYGRADGKAYVPGLEPDLLGEGIVVRVACTSVPTDGSVGEGMVMRVAGTRQRSGAETHDTWIEHVFPAGGVDDDADVVRTAFVVLGRISGAGARLVRPWMRLLLQRSLARSICATGLARSQGHRETDRLVGPRRRARRGARAGWLGGHCRRAGARGDSIRHRVAAAAGSLAERPPTSACARKRR
jgi:nucleoside phosphorylase